MYMYMYICVYLENTTVLLQYARRIGNRKVAVFRKIGKSRSWENVKIKPKSSIKYEGVRLIELNKTNLYVAIV